MAYGFDPDREGNPFRPLSEHELASVRSWEPPAVGDHDATVNGPTGNGSHGVQTAIHGSSSSRDHEIVNDPEAVPLFGFEKPPPLRWQVAGLIPEGFVTMLAADGGTGKSFLAVYLALCLCLGRSFFGLGTRRGRVLYVDFELNTEEQQRRVWRVAEGMGLSVDDERLKGRFFYYRPRFPLGTDQAHEEVLALIERHEVSLTILDSLTVASAGADVTASEDVVPVMQRFREWGTVFAIDHISSNSARGNQSGARPFGSVFKRNIARSTFTLAKADGGGLMLTPDKSNFTAKRDLVCYAVDFDGEDGPVTFEKVDETDDTMAGALKNMATHDVTTTAVKTLHEKHRRPVTAREVVDWRSGFDGATSVKEGTVQNHFTVLQRRGKIERTGDGGVIPAGVAYSSLKSTGFERGQRVETPVGKGKMLEAADEGRVAVRLASHDPNSNRVFNAADVKPVDGDASL